MEFVVEHDLSSTRAVILGRQGKYGEAVRQYLDENQESEALDLALAHIDEVTRDSEAFNAIVEKFLWRYLSFGCRGWSESADIPFCKMDKLLRSIPGTHLSDRDKKTVCDPWPFLYKEAANLCGTALYLQAHLSGGEVGESLQDPFQLRASL